MSESYQFAQYLYRRYEASGDFEIFHAYLAVMRKAGLGGV